MKKKIKNKLLFKHKRRQLMADKQLHPELFERKKRTLPDFFTISPVADENGVFDIVVDLEKLVEQAENRGRRF